MIDKELGNVAPPTIDTPSPETQPEQSSMPTSRGAQGDQPVDKYTGGMPPGGGGQEVDPKIQGQIDSFKSVLMKVMHSKETRGGVLDILKSSEDPFSTFPTAAVAINDMAVSLMSKGGNQVSFAVQLGASEYLISDLLHLGYAAAGWDELAEEEVKSLYEDTIQIVISRGLNDGSIDPIQLQLEGQDLMTEDQRRAGDMMAKDADIPSDPSQQVMMEQYSNSNVRSNENNMMQKAALKGGQ